MRINAVAAMGCIAICTFAACQICIADSQSIPTRNDVQSFKTIANECANVLIAMRNMQSVEIADKAITYATKLSQHIDEECCVLGMLTFSFFKSILMLSVSNDKEHRSELCDNISKRGIGLFSLGAAFRFDMKCRKEEVIWFDEWEETLGIPLILNSWSFLRCQHINAERNLEKRSNRDLVMWGLNTRPIASIDVMMATSIAEMAEKLGKDYAKYYEESIYSEDIPLDFFDNKKRGTWISETLCFQWVRVARGRMMQKEWMLAFEALAKAYIWGNDEIRKQCDELLLFCLEGIDVPPRIPVEKDFQRRIKLVKEIGKTYTDCLLYPRAIEFLNGYNNDEMKGLFNDTISEYKEEWRKEITTGLQVCVPFNYAGTDISLPDEIPRIQFPESMELLILASDKANMIVDTLLVLPENLSR